jgi:hypothetical protein
MDMILHGKHLAGSIARLGLALAGLACAFATAAEDMDRAPVPIDWSHRHLIYGNPDTPGDAIRKGTYDEWQKNYRDPRFVMALARKMERQAARMEAQETGSAKATRAPTLEGPSPAPSARKPREYPVSPRVSPPHRDWNIPMGGTGAAGVGAAGIFPAKYNFDISAPPSCANDFVVYPTSSAGVTGSGAFASRTGTVSGTFTVGTQFVTITNGTRSIQITAGATNSGLTFVPGANTAAGRITTATNLAAAIARNGLVVGVTATSNGTATMTITATSQGTGSNSIALTENSGGFSWSGTPLTGGSGTAGQPTIFAVNQLYSSCASATAGPPMAFWSYNTGTGAVVDSSPILSLDGTQVAFIQRSGSVASLVMLKWSASSPGTLGAPTVPTSVAAGAYRACVAPCMTSITLSGSPNNTNSSPYYYYETDQLWVGDDAGVLHKFTGVFLGTPAESGSPWPVTVDAGLILSPPVYDQTNNLVFIGTARTPDTAGTPHGGRLYSVSNATGAVIASGLLAGNVAATNSGSKGVAEAVIVDQLAQRVYTFVATDTNANAAICAGVECHAVYQFATNASISGLTAPKVTLGRGQIFGRVMYAGVFDDDYYNSANPASPTGALFACGSNSGAFTTSRHPTLWRIPIVANVMGTPAVGPSLVSGDSADAAANGGDCGPITDMQNGANNYIFLSIPDAGNQTGCTGACVYMFNITSTTAANVATLAATAGLAAPGGTGGIVVDNSGASASGFSQIYYSTITSPGGAVQASQAALN